MSEDFVKDVLNQYVESLEQRYNTLKSELQLEFNQKKYENMGQVAKTISQVAATIRELDRQAVIA